MNDYGYKERAPDIEENKYIPLMPDTPDMEESDYIQQQHAMEETPDDSTTPLRTTHPTLYAQLLSANTRISNAMGTPLFLCFLPAFALWCCVENQFEKDLLGVDLQAFRNWKGYLTLIIGSFFLFIPFVSFFEKRVYNKLKDNLLHALSASKLDRVELILRIHNDTDLSRISEMIEKDEEFLNRR